MEHSTQSTTRFNQEGELFHIPAMHGMEARHIQSRITADLPQTNGAQGLEIEVGVLDQTSGNPVQSVEALLAIINDRVQARSGNEIKPEVCASVAEQNIPHGTLEEVEANYISHQAAMIEALSSLGLLAVPVGMLPFSDRKEAQSRLWQNLLEHPDPFYQHILIPRDGEAIKALAYMSGFQTHTEQLHGETAVASVRALSILSPLFIALAASSPIIGGTYRGIQSERVEEKNNLRSDLTGLIPESAVRTYASMQDFLHRSAIDPERLSISPGYYWNRQPRIELGTVETATMDAIPDPGHALRMNRLSRAIVLAVAREMQAGRPPLPKEIFGDGTLSPENQDWIYRTVNQLQRSRRVMDETIKDINGRNVSIENFLIHLMQWAELPQTDQTAILEFLGIGTVSERIIKELSLESSNPTQVDDTRIKDVYLKWGAHYGDQLHAMGSTLAA